MLFLSVCFVTAVKTLREFEQHYLSMNKQHLKFNFVLLSGSGTAILGRNNSVGVWW